MIEIALASGKSLFFASDNHLGMPSLEQSHQRERLFVQWLEEIAPKAGALFLLGDLFDFWFEYKRVVPKGFVRVLGKLAQLRDQGLPIYFFVGNHDLWMGDYFEKELGIPVFYKPQEVSCAGKHFLIGHGDGLGPGDKGYKRMKKVFTNPFCKWLFRWLHPDIGVSLAQYCKRKQAQKHYDYFLFGHRHLPMTIDLGGGATYINTGDWIHYYTYAVFDGQKCQLMVRD